MLFRSEELVKSRLVKRMRSLGLAGFDQYIASVESSPAELYQMVDLLTTNKTIKIPKLIKSRLPIFKSAKNEFMVSLLGKLYFL